MNSDNGNRFIFLPRHSIQPKLNINAPGDQYEQEADAMANKIVSNGNIYDHSAHRTGLIRNSIQRKCASCDEEDKRKTLMRKTESSTSNVHASPSFLSSLTSSKGSGSPLPGNTRNFMENAFGTDFSAVRIHTDGRASEMSKGINAKAFTYGSDIYFDKGQYNHGSSGGKNLLAHELTHVLQQGGFGVTIQRYDNCSTAQDRIIDNGLARARRRSTRAIQFVEAIQSGTNRGAAASLRRFFGTLTPAQITTVHDRMVEADGRLNNDAVWRCDTAATYAHCGGADNWWAGTLCPTTADPTHLCPPVFTPQGDTSGVEPSRAMLLIHEALRAAGACGGVYPPGDRTPPNSLVNVYSYTQFMFNNASGSR